jgi:hypothetical protein
MTQKTSWLAVASLAVISAIVSAKDTATSLLGISSKSLNLNDHANAYAIDVDARQSLNTADGSADVAAPQVNAFNANVTAVVGPPSPPTSLVQATASNAHGSSMVAMAKHAIVSAVANVRTSFGSMASSIIVVFQLSRSMAAATG